MREHELYSGPIDGSKRVLLYMLYGWNKRDSRPRPPTAHTFLTIHNMSPWTHVILCADEQTYVVDRLVSCVDIGWHGLVTIP
jgi:hypothetical protein